MNTLQLCQHCGHTDLDCMCPVPDFFSPVVFDLSEVPPGFEPITLCAVCNSDNIVYGGIQDGGGDYGTAVCDHWRCEACGHEWEGDCVDDCDGCDE